MTVGLPTGDDHERWKWHGQSIINGNRLTIDGQQVTLVASTKRLRRVEKITGRGIFEIARELSTSLMRTTDLAAVIHACAKPKVSARRAAEMVEAEGALVLGTAVLYFLLAPLTERLGTGGKGGGAGHG